jgi:hypothetical protein
MGFAPESLFIAVPMNFLRQFEEYLDNGRSQELSASQDAVEGGSGLGLVPCNPLAVEDTASPIRQRRHSPL